MIYKLKTLFNKYFVYKGYVVIHQSDGVDNILEFNGYRDLQYIYNHYVPRRSDVTLYADVCSEIGSGVLFGLVSLLLFFICISLFY